MTKLILTAMVLAWLLLPAMAQDPCKQMLTGQQVWSWLHYKPVSVDLFEMSKRCNISDSIKLRLLYLLNSNWTQCEIEDYLQRDIIANYEVYEIEKRAKQQSGENSSKFDEAKAQILNDIKAKQMQYLREKKYFGVHESVIKAVALLGYKEAISILKNALKDTVGYFDKPTVELALAKLNDKFYLNKVMQECKYDNTLNDYAWEDDFQLKLKKLMFLESAESIYQLHQWLDTSKTREISSSGAIGKAAGYALAFLQEAIENEDFKRITEGIDVISSATDDVILRAKKWWIANKGKYRINKKKYPDLK
jgi:hypothetical protein